MPTASSARCRAPPRSSQATQPAPQPTPRPPLSHRASERVAAPPAGASPTAPPWHGARRSVSPASGRPERPGDNPQQEKAARQPSVSLIAGRTLSVRPRPASAPRAGMALGAGARRSLSPAQQRRWRFHANPKAGTVFCKIRDILRKLPFWEEVPCAGQRRQSLDVDLLLEDRYVADRLLDTHAATAAPPGAEAPAAGQRRLVNSYSGTKCLTLKAAMVKTLRRGTQEPWALTPATFVLFKRTLGTDDRESFCATFRQMRGSCRNVWILKPSHRNKGIGIEIFDDDSDALDFVDQNSAPEVNGGKATQYVAQKYIERPLLIHGRKFDLRTWVVLTPQYDIWMYREGVLRTASEQYALGDLSDRLSHLTNHCIQETGPNFGRFEEGNEMWYHQFQAYLDKHMPRRRGRPVSLADDILPQARHITVESLLASKHQLTPSGLVGQDGVRLDCFQLFGFDFMVDTDMKVWLIEVNGSPASAEALLHDMMVDLIEVVIEPVFPAPRGQRYRHNATNKFDCIYTASGGQTVPRGGTQARSLAREVPPQTAGRPAPVPEALPPQPHPQPSRRVPLLSPQRAAAQSPTRNGGASPRRPSGVEPPSLQVPPPRPASFADPLLQRINALLGTAMACGSVSPPPAAPPTQAPLPQRVSCPPRHSDPAHGAEGDGMVRRSQTPPRYALSARHSTGSGGRPEPSPAPAPLSAPPRTPPAADRVDLSPQRSVSRERVDEIIERIDSLLGRIRDTQQRTPPQPVS
eukprot:TRINITY_DN17465_c0_g1_i1.p1 TRINITY_DN17465_c0_g1~~TRINITY_DN17465_c0_g1_i1.p1  ORF type:complete len:750 (+),score=178.06 TRINITY_DN17465_c0_g1_i1:88-2337(+)